MACKYIKALICVTLIGSFMYYRVIMKFTATVLTKNTSMLTSASDSPRKGAESASASTASTNTTKENEVPGSCLKIPPGLVGKWVPRMEILNWTVLEGKHPELSAGGRWQPKDCLARHKVAIIIPYRKRSEHLHIFMNNMHDFLQRQQLDYGMYVVEQAGTTPFNRAMLLNVGYKEAMKDYKWQCIALHDVDHIPLNDQNLYTCPSLPRHLSVAIEKWSFKVKWANYFGGVSMLKSEHYEKINGMSNVYWGWGAEDDDLYNRNALLNTWEKRQATDGLSDLQYTILKKEYRHLYTTMLVDLGRMTSS